MSSAFYILVLLAICQHVWGSGKIAIKLVRFDNPNGLGANGNCCDGFSVLCASACDHAFVVCLDVNTGPETAQTCPYGRVETGEINNQDSITFTNYVGGIANPLIFTINSMPKKIKLKVDVWDLDDNAHDHVALLTKVITLDVYENSTTAVASDITMTKRVTLAAQVRAYCDPEYYGHQCSTYCSTSSNMHYDCEAGTGNRKCHTGWMGDYCDENINECSIEPNPCKNEGVCIDNPGKFTCNCTDEYKGAFCQVPVPKRCENGLCVNGGTCENTTNGFRCTCAEGWSGISCQHGVAACTSNPCHNNSTCTDTVGGFTCLCTAEWTGRMCDVMTYTGQTTTVFTSSSTFTSSEFKKIYLLGKVDEESRDDVIKALALLITDFTTLTGNLTVQIHTEYVEGENGEPVTGITIQAVSAGQNVSDDVISALFTDRPVEVLNNYLPYPVYVGAVHQPKEVPLENQNNWVQENWYLFLIAVLVILTVVIVLAVVLVSMKRKRSEQMNKNILDRSMSSISDVTPQPGHAHFENSLYFEMNNPNQNGLASTTTTPHYSGT